MDDRTPPFPPTSDDPWAPRPTEADAAGPPSSDAPHHQASPYEPAPYEPAPYEPAPYEPPRYDAQPETPQYGTPRYDGPAYDPYAPRPYEVTPGYDPAGSGPGGYAPPSYDGAYVAPGAWPAQPPAGGREPRRGVAVLAAVAICAGLVGGGVGGAIAYGAGDGDSASVSSLAAPVEPSRLDTPAGSRAPAGAIEKVAAKVLPSVVSIDVRGAGASSVPGLPGGEGGVAGSGSGVVISSDGLVLTNNHVAGQGDLTVTFADGRTLRADLIKADPATDLAVIKVAGISDATPIPFGSSAALAVGQEVVAIGSPLGLSGTVTTGIVSALNRPVIPQQGGGGGSSADDASVIDGIQTDAPINPGNSGGALVDLNGNLVGITSAIAALGGAFGGSAGSIGLGFAIPIDQARVVADKLARGETVAHALLGVTVTNSTEPTQRGALVQDVSDGGAAEDAGLRKGDIVTRLEERLIDTSNALVAGVRSRQPGEEVTLTFVRGNETRTADVSLGSDTE